MVKEGRVIEKIWEKKFELSFDLFQYNSLQFENNAILKVVKFFVKWLASFTPVLKKINFFVKEPTALEPVVRERC